MTRKVDPDLADFDDELLIDKDADKPALSHLSREELEDLLTKAEASASENNEALLRTRAEMENMRRRTERDLVQAHQFALEKIAKDLVTVVDNLERALEQGEGLESPVITGVELTLKQFQGILDKYAIKVIDPMGKSFDPASQEAMTMEVSDTVPPGTVVKVLQKGYQLHDRLLRPALVIVSKAA